MITAPEASRAASTADTVTVHWDDGTTGEFAAIWLRDNVPADRDAFSGQRLVDILDVPAQPCVRSATFADGELCVAWRDESSPSRFPLAWLYDVARADDGRPERRVRMWLEGSLRSRQDFARLAHSALQSDAQARLAWLTRLLQDGIAFVDEVPAADRAMLTALQSVGSVMETNYGLVFEVRAVPAAENLADTDLGLGLHTDNPYREPVPGFQALHVLVASPDGGDSQFADGFALAGHLRATDPDSFARLTGTPVPFCYQSGSADLYAERPLIELSCDGRVSAINYNNRSIRAVRLPAGECADFYRAYRAFASLLRESRFQMRTHMQSGEMVVFDNRRVLHGRSAFTSRRHPRHLQGCYLSRDSLFSTAALLRRRLVHGDRA